MRKVRCPTLMGVLFSLVFLVVPASGLAGQTLEIIQPGESQTLTSSNIPVSVRFGFDIQSAPGLFQAWLNGKPVGGLFEFTDDKYVAKALLSPKDGLNASDKGNRMNVFSAVVEGPDGNKYRQMVRFTVDCSGNHAPVAQVAVEDDHVFAHEFVQLDGSGSSDADADPLVHTWSLVTMPKHSKATFSDPSAVNPSFIPDVPGTYIAQLVVDDYKSDSSPKTVTIEAAELKILIEHPVYDKIFEILSRNGFVTQSDAISDIKSHHVAILDGNGRTVDDIRNSKLLKDMLHEGKWGLVLNPTDEQKIAGLTPHLGIVSKVRSKAVLFRRLRDGNTPVVRILDLPELDPSVSGSDPDILARHAGILLKMLRQSIGISPVSSVSSVSAAASRSVLGSAPPPDKPPPPDLVNVRWEYRSLLPFSFDHSGRQSVSKGRIQTGSYVVNHTFTLFLDNGNNPTGNKQYLLLQVDTNSNARNAETSWMASAGDMDKHNEYAWFQDYVTVSAVPVEADPTNPKWFWVNNDPSSPNNITTYTANASFSVGFNQAQGILGNFGCSFSDSYQVTDWGILCQDCSMTNVKWKFHSTNPPEHSGSYFAYGDMYDWYYGCGKPKEPNAISMGQAILRGAVAWDTNNKVLTEPATIASRIEIGLVDNWCSKDLGTTCCSSWNRHTSKVTISKDFNFEIDVAAVIPVEMASISFDPNPVSLPAGSSTTIKGYINLSEPAKIDTKITGIKAASLNYNAFPRVDSIIIPKGDTSGSFDIDVNTNGLSRNQSVTVGISAFYTKTYTYSLTIHAQ